MKIRTLNNLITISGVSESPINDQYNSINGYLDRNDCNVKETIFEHYQVKIDILSDTF